jgi:Bacterial PH domain
VLSQQASSRKDPDSEREVFRSPGSAILSWAWFVVAVIILIDLAVQGRDHAAVVTAVLVLAITGVVYACAWRPKIVADSSGIAVINPVRDHQVPWAAVSKVDVVNAVRVHCESTPGGARGKVLYSWAVQSSPRSTRKAALRREAHSQPRPRLTPRPRVLQPPPSTTPRGYGELPDSAKDAMERSTADFTAGRLAERAQHARQAAARAAGLSSSHGQAAAGGPAPASAPPAAASPPRAGSAAATGPVPAGGPAPAGDQAGIPAVSAGSPEPWFANVTEDARPAVEQAGTPAADSPAPGSEAVAGDQAMATAQWAWLAIAAMVVPLVLLLLVVLV